MFNFNFYFNQVYRAIVLLVYKFALVQTQCSKPTELVNSTIHDFHSVMNWMNSPYILGQDVTYDCLPNTRTKLGVDNSRYLHLPGEDRSCRRVRWRSEKIQTKTICPWHYVIDYSDEREPQTLYQARCNCHKCRGKGNRKNLCHEVKIFIPVLRYDSMRKRMYPSAEEMSVACVCQKRI